MLVLEGVVYPMLSIQGRCHSILSIWGICHSMLRIWEGFLPTLGLWRDRHDASGYWDPRNPTFDLEEFGIIALRGHDDGYPMLGMRELAFPSWSIQEEQDVKFDLWSSNSMVRIHMAWGHPTLEDEEVSSFTLTMERVGDFTLSYDDSLLQGRIKGSLHFALTIIFSRLLQVQSRLNTHAFSWLWKILIKSLLRGDHKPKCLHLALEYGHEV